MAVKHKGRAGKVVATSDGTGVVSHAGSALIALMADRLGLGRALDRRLVGLYSRAPRCSPGKVLVDLAVTLADGGDCPADVATLRGQQTLFGPVASDATVYRVIERVAAAGEPGLEMLRSSRAEVRARAWRRGARPRRVVIDLDATLIDAHTEKPGATPTWKRGFGFHPMLAFLDATGQPLAGLLRAGRANANDGADQIRVLELALEQLPASVRRREPILMRADTAGCVHALLEFCRDRQVRFSVGMPLTEPVRTAVLAAPADFWQRAIGQDGVPRDHDGATVCEITHLLDMTRWPAGSRVLVRREEAHPGAQFSFTDHDGHRFQAVLTDQADRDIAYLEAVHRGHARVEDQIRACKDTGLRNLPFRDYAMNAVWLEIVALARDLTAYVQALCLTGEHTRSEPKRLRYQLLHTAARLSQHARQAVLRFAADWPHSRALAAAFVYLNALPPPAR